jgi:polysaccharide export outer membrane protein
MYHIGLTTEAEDYRLGVSDEINVEFFFHPQINRTLVIRPDGKITLPIKGDIRAAGLKPQELAAAINNQFSDILNNPQVIVIVNKYSSKIAELQKAITNSPRGQAKMMMVGPDGNIYLPMLKGIKAAGKTIDELKEDVTKEYRREFNNLQVSFLIESITGNRIFVFGEVRTPGVITSGKPLTAVQAIASAGGILPTGSWEKVKVMHWNDKNETELRTVNVNNVMMNMKLEEDLILPPNSVVYIPKTTIAKLDQFVDQYITQLFLFNGTALSITKGVTTTSGPAGITTSVTTP